MLLCILSSIPFAYASSTTVISLSDSKITVNGETISTDTSSSVYLSSQMDNGGTSTDATNSNIEISNIININSAGTYEFSGILTDGQISVNTNNIVGGKIKQSVESWEDQDSILYFIERGTSLLVEAFLLLVENFATLLKYNFFFNFTC